MAIGFKTYSFMVESSGWTAIDLTGRIEELVTNSGFNKGLATVYTPEENVVVTLIEYEPNLLSDLEELINKLKGPGSLVEALIGKSIVVPITNHSLDLGVFKHIVLVDLSRKKGAKKVIIGIEGIHGNKED
ncbi:MAG: YjbQ family protein [Desulfurococcales archaeon]|nr:YjbQ family protein [Desulfurococcales archaeon]